MRLILQYLVRRLLVSALCAVTQTSLVDHEYRQLRIDASAMTMVATLDDNPEQLTWERVMAKAERASSRGMPGAACSRLDVAEAANEDAELSRG